MRVVTKAWYAALCIALVLGGSVHWFAVSHGGDTWRGATLAAMTSGSAERPYVYRWLVPQTLRLIDEATPPHDRAAIHQQLADWRDNIMVRFDLPRGLARALSPQQDAWLYMRALWFGVIVVSLALFTIGMHQLAKAIWPQQPQAAIWSVVLAWSVVLLLPAPVIYLYDPPVLALSALALSALAARRWRLYAVMLLVAGSNKESSVLLLFMLVWLALRQPRMWLSWPNIAMLALLWAGIRAGALMAFHENPGVVLKTQYWPYYLEHPHWLLLWIAGVGLLLWQARRMNELLKASAGMITIMVVAYLLFGKPGELRVLYDVVPLMSLLMVQMGMDARLRLRARLAS